MEALNVGGFRNPNNGIASKYAFAVDDSLREAKKLVGHAAGLWAAGRPTESLRDGGRRPQSPGRILREPAGGPAPDRLVGFRRPLHPRIHLQAARHPRQTPDAKRLTRPPRATDGPTSRLLPINLS
jgi:hypothetical protein